MTVASEITRLQWAKADIKTSIENKWVTVPSSTKLDWYSTLIDSIQTWVPQATYNAMQTLAWIPAYMNMSWGSSYQLKTASLACWDYYIYAWSTNGAVWYAVFVWHPQYWCVHYWYQYESWYTVDVSWMTATLYENWVLSLSVIWRTTSVNSSTWLLQWWWTASWSVVATSTTVTKHNWVQWSAVARWANSALATAYTIQYVW